MVGSHKILTVSYGTFSCTLEGFDDSFGTMKAIAEYFRDLAADDRYFGAEPPTPDAEMLTRIAEREIARRVEARLDAKGIVLRATGPEPAEATAEPAPQPAAPQITEPQAALPAAAEVRPADAAAEAEVHDPAPLLAAAASAGPTAPVAAAPAPVAMPPAARAPEAAIAAPATPRPGPRIITAPRGMPLPADDNSVAAKLQRIRAVVGKADAPVGESEENAAMPVAAAPLPVDATVAAVMATVAGPEPAGASAEVGSEAADDEAAAPEMAAEPVAVAEGAPREAAAAGDAGPTVAQPQAPDALAKAAPPLQPDAGAVATDAPQPIRARVIRMRRADFERAVAQGQIDTPAAIAALAAAPAVQPTLSPEAEADLLAELAAVEQEAAMFDAPQEDAVEEDASTAIADAPEVGDQDDDARMAAVMAALDDGQDLASANPDDADSDDGVDIAALTRALGDAEPDHDTATADAVVTPEEALVASAEIATAEEEAAEDAAMLADHDAAIAAALADAAARGAPASVPAEAIAEPAAEETGIDSEEPASAAVTHEHLRVQTDEAALDRIMSQTDAHLNTDEASRRRAAITQLRAAVAATEAARRLGETAEPEEDDEVENAFRDDLKQAVRPRRPVATGEARSDRPRPAPLKLVASQRIDQPPPAPAAAPAQVVRPRRVTVAAEPAPPAPAAAATAGTFEDYAREVGATTLPDLLEAAAAYTSFVEGIEDFSRPQLMKKVTGLAPDRFNREDTLRTFGTLLREGRITRSGMGRFQVSEQNRYHPSRRAG